MCSSYYEHISNIRASESTYLSLISSEPIWFLEIVCCVDSSVAVSHEIKFNAFDWSI